MSFRRPRSTDVVGSLVGAAIVRGLSLRRGRRGGAPGVARTLGKLFGAWIVATAVLGLGRAMEAVAPESKLRDPRPEAAARFSAIWTRYAVTFGDGESLDLLDRWANGEGLSSSGSRDADPPGISSTILSGWSWTEMYPMEGDGTEVLRAAWEVSLPLLLGWLMMAAAALAMALFCARRNLGPGSLRTVRMRAYFGGILGILLIGLTGGIFIIPHVPEVGTSGALLLQTVSAALLGGIGSLMFSTAADSLRPPIWHDIWSRLADPRASSAWLAYGACVRATARCRGAVTAMALGVVVAQARISAFSHRSSYVLPDLLGFAGEAWSQGLSSGVAEASLLARFAAAFGLSIAASAILLDHGAKSLDPRGAEQ